MADDEIAEWKKLSTFDKVQHANWKCRKMGYEDLQKELQRSMEGDAIFKKYSILVKKLVTEQNELSRMLASEVAVLVVEGMTTKDAAKVATGVVDGIILKCFNSKAKTRQNGTELCLQFLEHEKAEDVVASLLTGSSNKQPKIAAACVETLKECLAAFGHKIVTVKGAFATLPKLFHHRDKLVRGAVRDFFVEAHAWIGPIVKQQLEREAKIEHCIKECEELWSEQKTKSKQKRFFKSQVELRAKAEAQTESGGDEEEDEEEDEPDAIDTFDILPETPLLPMLTKKFKFEDEEETFYDFIESKKWKERGAALDALNKALGMDIVKLPDTLETLPPLKLAQGDYGPLAKALMTCIKKDTNVLLLIKAFTSVSVISNGLRDKFKNYGSLTIAEILGRFKEKKVTVVAAGRMAADSCARTIKFPDQVVEALCEKLADKNPSIRSECTMFIMRNVKPKAVVLAKPVLKELMPKLIANLSHPDKAIRESTAKCLAVLKGKIGEKVLNVFTAELKDDKRKLLDDAVAELKNAAGDGVAAAPAKTASPKKAEPKKAEKKEAKGKPVKKVVGKKPATKKTEKEPDSGPPKEAEINDDVAVDKCSDAFGEQVVKEVQNSAWKVRLEHLQQMCQKCAILGDELEAQPVFRVLSLKPGFKDTNFQCNQEKFKIIAHCGKTPRFSETSFNLVLDYCLDKLSDPKCGPLAQEALCAMAEYLSLPFVIGRVLPMAEKLKNVKNVAAIWEWLAAALPQFGFGKLNVAQFVEASKKALGHTNAKVRQGAIESIAVVMRFLPQLRNMFSGEKDALQKQIDEAAKTYEGETVPVPVRGPAIRSPVTNNASDKEDAEPDNEDDDDDLMPRADISSKLTDELINQIGDANWKMRRDALAEVKTLLEQNKFITPDLGQLPVALAKRLGDVNKVLLATVIEIWILVAASLGAKGAKKHFKSVVNPMIGVMNDGKVLLREKAASALSSWLELVPMRLWFDDESVSEMLVDAKKVHLRATFLTWLGEKLKDQKKVPKSGLEACLKHVYTCMEDRDGKVRAGAHSALFGFMLHLGFAKMAKEAPTGKQKVREELDKIKDQMPAAPAPKAEVIDAAAVMAQATGAKATKKKTTTPTSDSPSSPPPDDTAMEIDEPKKKKPAAKTTKPKTVKGKLVVEEALGEIITGTEKQKEQRFKDDTKLKTLKWTFDQGTLPREELVEQLKTQCSTAFGDKFLAFFHKTDGPSQMKALALLEKEPLDNVKVVLDLILRWMTIRFNEKNTTVLTKCLNWLVLLFEQLNHSDYRMLSFEAYAFLPHLISKLGESRQEVRDAIHQLLRSTVFFYSNIKVFEEILGGAKSKNSRTRTECLKHCGEMIAKHGESVWGSPKQGALKELAGQISDRDQNVRSAALNALVEVHRLIGDKLHDQKRIGRLGEKEESYLKERIKRAGGSGGGAADETKVVVKKGTKPTERRGTFTVKKGTNAKPVTRDAMPTQAISEEEEPATPTPEPECRFKLEEPLPSSIQIGQMNLIEHQDLDELLEPPPPPVYKYKERVEKLSDEEKLTRSVKELGYVTNKYRTQSTQIIDDIIAQLKSNEHQRVIVALTSLNALIKKEPRFAQVESKVNDVTHAMCEVLDTMVAEMLLTTEESEPIIKIISHIAVVQGHIIRIYHDCMEVPAIAQMTESLLSLLHKKSLNARCQSVEPKLMSLLQNVIHFAIQRLPLPTTLMAMVKLSAKYVEMRDETLIRFFIRVYHKAIQSVDTTVYAWTADAFEPIYTKMVDYNNEFPKDDPVYTGSKTKLDILRCHVSLCNKFTQRYPTIAQSVLDRNAHHENLIKQRINNALMQLDTMHEKENEVRDPLRHELIKLLRDASDRSKSSQAVEQVYKFTKRNPAYDIASLLGEPQYSKYFRLHIERQLEMLRNREVNLLPVRVASPAPDLTIDQHKERIAALRESLGMEPLVNEVPLPTLTVKQEEVIPDPMPQHATHSEASIVVPVVRSFIAPILTYMSHPYTRTH